LTNAQKAGEFQAAGIGIALPQLEAKHTIFTLDAAHPFNAPNVASFNGIAYFCCSLVENDIEVLPSGNGFLDVWFQGVNPARSCIVTFHTWSPSPNNVKKMSGKTNPQAFTYAYNSYQPTVTLNGTALITVAIPAGCNTAELRNMGSGSFWVFDVTVEEI